MPSQAVPGRAYDAVVVGAGPNGLVAANLLADDGWSVLVVEAEEQLGGAVRTDEELYPAFRHDTFSAFYPFAAASQVIRSLHLEEHGLRWADAPVPLAHPRREDWAAVLPDREGTAALMDEHHRGDGEAWLDLCRTWDVVGPPLVDSLTGPLPPLRSGSRLLAALARRGGMPMVRELLSPAASFGTGRFGGDDARLLVSGTAGHSDIPLDAPGSTALGLLLTMLAQTVGYPVPVGGAGRLTEAMARRLEARGGTVVTGTPVRRVVVEGGRVVAVRTDDGEVRARHAVLAAVSVPQLYGTLVAEDDLPASVRRGLATYELDPATVKVDWALSGPVPWRVPPPAPVGSFHVGDSVEQLQEATTQVSLGLVPAAPFLLAGQMTTTDPTRSPEGTESMWAYTHVPHRVRDDAGGEGLTGRWDDGELERFGDRVQARVEALAPGFGSRVLARRVLGPQQLQTRNRSLVGGAVNGGTSQLHQMLVLRPFPGDGRPGTGIGGLLLASSSAHPGGGVHGAPGANAARAAIWARRRHRLRPGRPRP